MEQLRRRKLLDLLKAGEQEARRHPSVALQDRFALTPHELSPEERVKLKKHIAECERCRRVYDDTRAKKDFFSRQRPPCD